jgi:hypothetical protein
MSGLAMAVFQHNNRLIPYRIVLAPFHFDVVLLQSSRQRPDFWDDVLESLEGKEYGGGRILVCEWAEAKLDDKQVASDFVKLMQTLALVSTRVVALDDAVEMVADAQTQQSRLFEKTLLFPEGGPKGEELKRAVLELCQA